VTDAIPDEIAAWPNRPLETVYPRVFFDALRVKVRDDGTVRNKAVDLAPGVRADGRQASLGLWVEPTERAKCWRRVMTELKNRGVEDILLAVVDGRKGCPAAITAVFPPTQVQTCIVHPIRNALAFVSSKERKAVAAAWRGIYQAKDAAAGAAALDAFDAGEWGLTDPAIAPSWRRHGPAVIPFFAFPVDVRRIVSTTNAIAALNAKLRRAVRTRGHVPSDDSACKLLFLVLNPAERGWRMPPRECGLVRAQRAILFDNRCQIASASNVQPMAHTRNS
jgi:putative transposase